MKMSHHQKMSTLSCPLHCPPLFFCISFSTCPIFFFYGSFLWPEPSDSSLFLGDVALCSYKTTIFLLVNRILNQELCNSIAAVFLMILHMSCAKTIAFLNIILSKTVSKRSNKPSCATKHALSF